MHTATHFAALLAVLYSVAAQALGARVAWQFDYERNKPYAVVASGSSFAAFGVDYSHSWAAQWAPGNATPSWQALWEEGVVLCWPPLQDEQAPGGFYVGGSVPDFVLVTRVTPGGERAWMSVRTTPSKGLIYSTALAGTDPASGSLVLVDVASDVGQTQSWLTWLDPESGAMVATQAISDKGDSYARRAVFSPDRSSVVVHWNRGPVRAFSASPEGQRQGPLWALQGSFDLMEPVARGGVGDKLGGCAWVAGSGYVALLSCKDGAALWKTSVACAEFTAVAEGGDSLVVACAGDIHGLDAALGEQRWIAKVEGTASVLLPHEATVYVIGTAASVQGVQAVLTRISGVSGETQVLIVGEAQVGAVATWGVAELPDHAAALLCRAAGVVATATATEQKRQLYGQERALGVAALEQVLLHCSRFSKATAKAALKALHCHGNAAAAAAVAELPGFCSIVVEAREEGEEGEEDEEDERDQDQYMERLWAVCDSLTPGTTATATTATCALSALRRSLPRPWDCDDSDAGRSSFFVHSQGHQAICSVLAAHLLSPEVATGVLCTLPRVCCCVQAALGTGTDDALDILQSLAEATLEAMQAHPLCLMCFAQCEGEGSEIYDSAPYKSIGGPALNANPRVCGGDVLYTSMGLAQVFTPRSFPWRFTRVCFVASVSVDSPKGALQLVGEIGTYEVVADLANSRLAVGDRLSFTSFSAPVYKANGTHAWVSIDLSDRDLPLVVGFSCVVALVAAAAGLCYVYDLAPL
eukprot:m51a1_g539 hypothetical protein (756) ;mRNA; r:400221-416806